MTDTPLVSVVVPCYNERATIGLLLDALYAQTYPRQQMEVIIADGRSTDGTREAIAAWQQAHPDLTVRVVDNPPRIIPAGLNRAIAAARGEIIVRLDAHAVPAEDYVARSVAALQAGRGDNVGGRWDIRPQHAGWMARSIAAAAAHPWAVGDARYRYSQRAGQVDTVPFGAFYRSLVERIGPFDESLLSNEDYEFNARLRAHGGRIWFDPRIRSVYFARPSLHALARQYWRYGYWKVQMLRRYPHTLRWRQLLPPLFVALLVIFALLSPWVWWARGLLALQAGLYGAVLLGMGLQTAWRARAPRLFVGVPLAAATMHLAWGAAFWWGLLFPPR